MLVADPLWKYGDRAVRPRRIGPLVLPISAHWPLIMARPRSVTSIGLPRKIAGCALHMEYRQRGGVEHRRFLGPGTGYADIDC